MIGRVPWASASNHRVKRTQSVRGGTPHGVGVVVGFRKKALDRATTVARNDYEDMTSLEAELDHGRALRTALPVLDSQENRRRMWKRA